MPWSRAAADQQLHDLLAGERVERAGRLVGEQHLGRGDQPAGERDPLGLTAGQLARAALLEAVEVEPVEPGRAPRSAPRHGGCRRAAAAARRSPRRSARARAGRTGTRSRTGRGAARCARSRAACRCRWPAKWTSPESGTRMPARQCSSVDLPEPLGPITARISPARHRDGRPAQRRRLAERQARRRAPRRTPSVMTRTSLARASRRAAVRSIQRRSASRWNSPWSASSASTTPPAALELGQLAHALQVRGALGVEVVLGRAARASGPARPWRTARSAGAARARPAAASQVSTSVTPCSVIT